MKKSRTLLATGAFLLLLSACNTPAGEENKESGDAKKEAPALPYTPSYSGSFEIGNPAFSATILQGSWKDWEENKLDNMKDWVADSIVAMHSDNVVTVGRDSLMARWKRGRAEYSSVIDTIDAVIPVYSTDKKEHWVLVWATEINTKTDGSKDTSAIMETWRMNKDGKADMLLQYNRAKRKP